MVASGATSLFKGDVKSRLILADCKYTERSSYRVTSETWFKLCEWARNEGKRPVLAVRVAGVIDACVVDVDVMFDMPYEFEFASQRIGARSVTISGRTKVGRLCNVGDSTVGIVSVEDVRRWQDEGRSR